MESRNNLGTTSVLEFLGLGPILFLSFGVRGGVRGGADHGTDLAERQKPSSLLWARFPRGAGRRALAADSVQLGDCRMCYDVL